MQYYSISFYSSTNEGEIKKLNLNSLVSVLGIEEGNVDNCCNCQNS